LRFDKVALRLIAGLQTTLRDAVPKGKTLLVTVSAPILVPANTGAALENQIRAWLAGGSKPAEFRATVNGNEIAVRIVSGTSKNSPGVLVFVHNPDVDTAALFDEALSSLNDR
jgi:predicted RNase H-like nuclease